MPHPIPYQGSKRNLADRIIRYFPAKYERLVEPFAGSAAISLAVAVRNASIQFWLNDAHKPLQSLWAAILHDAESLAKAYGELWKDQIGRERAFYDEVRNRFNQKHLPADFLYLLARCVKAAIRYNAQGQFNNSPDNRRLGAAPAAMRCRVVGAHVALKNRTTVTSLDYAAVLSQVTSDDVVYMDPPYQGVCGKRDARYAPAFEHSAFADRVAELIRRKCRLVISYDGRTGDVTYGQPLPNALGLTRIELPAGRSTQATLLGRDDLTYESLYLSPALVAGARKTPTLFDSLSDG